MTRRIGLDNPAIRGNLRTYQRREVIRPTRPSYVMVEDVVETDSAPGLVLVPRQQYQASEPQYTQSTPEPERSFVNDKPEIVTDYFSGSIDIYSDDESNDFLQAESDLDAAADWFNETQQGSISSLADKSSTSRNVQPKPRKRRIFSIQFLLPTMAVVLFLVGCGVALQGIRTNRYVQAQVQGVSTNQTSNEDENTLPDETEPDQSVMKAYYVAPDMPRYIRINKIGVNARVMLTGVKADNELKAPNSIYDAGWYENSAKPGEPGAALIDGHVHGPTKPGVFYKLKNLKIGDEIEIERGDGKLLTYIVSETEKRPYKEVDMNKAMRSNDTSKSGLNIITCTGKYNKDLKQYEERQIIYATLK